MLVKKMKRVSASFMLISGLDLAQIVMVSTGVYFAWYVGFVGNFAWIVDFLLVAYARVVGFLLI